MNENKPQVQIPLEIALQGAEKVQEYVALIQAHEDALKALQYAQQELRVLHMDMKMLNDSELQYGREFMDIAEKMVAKRLEADELNKKFREIHEKVIF